MLLRSALRIAVLFSVLRGDPTAAQVPAYRNDLLDPLNHAEQEIVALASAIPAEKYSWRPAKGVRSVGEVYQHIANGNNLILTFVAAEPLSRKELNQMIQNNASLEQTVTDKQQIIANVKTSFERVRAAIMKMSPADMDRPVKFFGTDGTVRGVLISICTHAHEHLGQSVAYARMMGIAPPWSKGS